MLQEMRIPELGIHSGLMSRVVEVFGCRDAGLSTR